MKFTSLIIAALLFISSAYAQKKEQYSRAKIYLDNTHTISQLAGLGLAVDHGEHKKNTFFVSDFSATELKQAKDAGFKVDIIIADVSKHYSEQNKKKAAKVTSGSCSAGPEVPVPTHFHLGTYGGYFTYDEALAILDSMQSDYPGLISVKAPIGSFLTIEGRPMYWVRISNSPATDQPAKPQMLVTSVHHAREPGSLSSNIFYLWYLLEHYATDPQVKAIIDNTELYFVPVVNPDGYIRNLTSDPLGGGMWRKNQRDNLDGTMGVDLNRNYGYFWGYDNIGSSPMTSSDTYRGTSGFSEPETQAIKWFTEQHNFKFTLNYHTFNNDLIYPWGYIPSHLTNDSSLFFSYGSFITEDNAYRYGTCDQTLSYITNGDSDDWMYGDITTKGKIFAFTPEIGANEFGFYTPIDNIIPDCQANLQANINTASLLLPYATLHGTDDKILTTSTGQLHYSLQRIGLDTATFTVNVVPLDSWITVPATPHVYTGLALLQQVNDSFSYTLSASTPNGQLVSYVLKVNNGLYDVTDTVRFYYGKHNSITTPSTSSLTDWNSSGWSVCTNSFYSSPSSIKSSLVCADNYQDLGDVTIDLINPIDLTHSIDAWLRFYARWGIESNYDFVAVQASVIGTGIWQPLCGRHTKPGSLSQWHNEPIYDGQQPTWVKEQIDLSDYLGQKILIRFELVSDAANNYEGFYFDDLQVKAIQDTATLAPNITATTPVVSVYPNPTHNMLNISVSGFNPSQALHAELYDCLGREVMNFDIDKPTTAINIQALPANVYYLKINNNGNVMPVQKVVIR